MRTPSLFRREHCYDAARAGVQPMVDVTFPFIILLGGLLVGFVTARVRGHTGWRKAADILVAAICGPAATSLWMSLVPRLVGRTPEEPYMSREWALLLADALWFSPVIGGFIGVAAVAIGYRLADGGSPRPRESWGEKLGAALQIVGWVYAVISVALIVGVVILAVAYEATGVISPALFVDLLIGPVVILIGWVLVRLFRTPDTQPAAPSLN
jgi:MFS family permease